MIKLAIVVVCAIFVINCAIGSSQTDQLDELIKNITACCKKQENATDNDIANWKNDTQPPSEIAACLDACFFEKLGLMVNNKLNVTAVMKYVEMENKNVTILSAIKAVVDGCASVTDPNRCKAVTNIMICMDNGARKQNVTEFLPDV